MVKRTKYCAQILLGAVIITFTTPFVLTANEAGQDWYCSDPKAHSEYEAHFKKHLDNSAEAITAQLDAIYNDSKLSRDEKKSKTIDILNRHLAKMKLGTGD